MADEETVSVYDTRADDYADMVASTEVDEHLVAFMDELPSGGHVLDLGCGPGHAAATMTAAGFDVDAWDASEGMVRLAADTSGVRIERRDFDSLDAVDAYDGIFANFSLLHARKAEMPDLLGRIARALRPGGVLHLALKTGTGERRDAIGRFYSYYEESELEGLLTRSGLGIASRATGSGRGLDGSDASWIIVRARPTDDADDTSAARV